MAGGETPPLRVRYLLKIESLLFNIAYLSNVISGFSVISQPHPVFDVVVDDEI